MTTEIVVNGHKIDDSTTFEYIPNPKRQNSMAHSRYEQYQNAVSLVEYLELAEKKYAKADLRFDEEKGHLKLFNEDGEQINAPKPIEPTEPTEDESTKLDDVDIDELNQDDVAEANEVLAADNEIENEF